jgi:nucleotide-binding universal stress UspA family protein
LEKIEQVVREGDPAKIVVKRAKKLDVDLLVVGTRGLTGIKGITLGSVAHKVTAAAHCPVLVVK